MSLDLASKIAPKPPAKPGTGPQAAAAPAPPNAEAAKKIADAGKPERGDSRGGATEGWGSGVVGYNPLTSYNEYQNAILFLESRRQVMEGLLKALDTTEDAKQAERDHEKRQELEKYAEKLRGICRDAKAAIEKAKTLMAALFSASVDSPASKAAVEAQLQDLSRQIGTMIDSISSLQSGLAQTDFQDLSRAAVTLKQALQDVRNKIDENGPRVDTHR